MHHPQTLPQYEIYDFICHKTRIREVRETINYVSEK